MSRAGYTEDYDDNWQLICWRGAVASAIRGKRGQSFLQEMLAALDALPEKRLISGELKSDGDVCALGAVGAARGLDMDDLDPYDHERVSVSFGVANALAREIMFENDEAGRPRETPEERYIRVRRWTELNLRRATAAEPSA